MDGLFFEAPGPWKPKAHRKLTFHVVFGILLESFGGLFARITSGETSYDAEASSGRKRDSSVV
jgi:hypothetical protein